MTFRINACSECKNTDRVKAGQTSVGCSRCKIYCVGTCTESAIYTWNKINIQEQSQDMSEIKLVRHPETNEIIPEIWKDIDGYDGWYQVSNYGRVRSWINKGWRRRDNPKILKVSKVRYTDNYKSCQVRLVKRDSNPRVKNKIVARLVAEAFIPNPENKPEVNHKDSDSTNNYESNLEWCTSSENTLHAVRNGRQENVFERGESHAMSKLQKHEVEEIYLSERPHAEIADEYGISASTVYKIKSGDRWTHITQKL